MKKIVLWFSSTAATVVMLFGYHTSTQGVAATATAQQPIGGSLATSTTSTTTTSGTGPDTGSTGTSGSGTSSSGTSSAAADSQTVTGDVVQTRWGPVQVQISTQGGQITSVEVEMEIAQVEDGEALERGRESGHGERVVADYGAEELAVAAELILAVAAQRALAADAVLVELRDVARADAITGAQREDLGAACTDVALAVDCVLLEVEVAAEARELA